MGFVSRALSVLFKEYNIPARPVSFLFELLLCVVAIIPKVIISVISYVYFPADPKSVAGKTILVRSSRVSAVYTTQEARLFPPAFAQSVISR